jgi:AGZA family xanthine/uracil permease-like MFS transporter
MRSRLERYFRFAEHNTNWRTETLAGLTTFITMAYIIFVNPSILAETGMPIAAVTIATCLCAAFGSILMGALANYPLALAPGMGLNAYFTYTVVKGMGVPWQTALGAVFLSGLIFLLLTFGGIRQRLLAAIPYQLHAAVASGIGLFIAFIGLRNHASSCPARRLPSRLATCTRRLRCSQSSALLSLLCCRRCACAPRCSSECSARCCLASFAVKFTGIL